LISNNIYKKIVSNAEIQNILLEYFDFEMIKASRNTKDYFFIIDYQATVLAQDASGGIFALIEDIKDSPIIYVSSEGQAGKVGERFEDFIIVMVTCPFWRDLLKFSGNGQVSEMRRALPFLKDEILEDFPNIEEYKNMIISELSLWTISDPVQSLYNSIVSEPQIPVFSIEGGKFDSLFNSYVVTDNPHWRNKVQ